MAEENVCRFADWTPDNITIRDKEGYVLELKEGKLVRKLPWTKDDGKVKMVP